VNCGSCSFFSLASFYQTELSLTPRLPRSCCAFGAGVRSTTCSEGTAPLAPGAPHPSLYTISRPLISWASLRKGSAKTGTQSSREQIASCTVSSLYYMSLVPLPPMMIFYLPNNNPTLILMMIFIVIRYHQPAKFERRRWPLESVSSPTDRIV